MSEWVAPGGAGDGQSTEREPPKYGELAPEGWTPPAQDPANPHAPVAPLGQPPSGWTPPPPYPGRQPGWTPPPKPGLLPLRPLTLGDVISAAFQVIRRNPRPTFGFALLVNVVVTVAVGGATAGIGWLLFSRYLMAADGDQATIGAGSVLLFLLTALLTGAVSNALMGLVQGVISQEVARGTLGEKLTLKALWAEARGRIWALVGWTLLVSLATAIAVGIVVGAVVAFLPLGLVGIVLSIVLGLLIGAGVLVLCLWLWIKLAFVPSLIVIERLHIRAAMRRSWSLTRANWWRIFGILILLLVIVMVAGEIIATPVSLVGGIVGGILNPNGTEDVTNGVTIAFLALSVAVSTVISAVQFVAQAAAPTVLYLDIRMRKEGLDLELQRYTEQTAAGQHPPDPFRPDPER